MSTMQMTGATLWAALSWVVSFITDKLGIEVVRSNGGARTDSKRVWLPRLPDGLLTRKEVVMVIGYLYHECAHIMKSDFTLKGKTPLHHAIGGVLEDIRIEDWAQGFFPAARKYLSELVRYLAEAGMAGESPSFCVLNDELSEAEVLQWYILYRLRHDLLGQTGIKPAMDTAVGVASKMFPRGMIVRLEALMFEVKECTSEAEVLELADAIVEMIKEEKAKEPPPPPPPPPKGEAGEEEGGGDSGVGDSGEDGSKSGNSGGNSAGEDGDANGDPQAGPGKGGQTGEQDDSQPGQAGGKGAGGTGDLDALLNMGEAEIVDSVGDMLGEAIDEVAQARAGTGTSMPNLHKLPLREARVDLSALKATVNATRTKTLQWMQSASQSQTRLVQRGLVIDPTALAMARVGGSVFVEEEEGIDLNSAWDVVIDRSGSMGHLIAAAVQAAVATMLAFDAPGIKTQVSVFPVYDQTGDEGVAIIKGWDDSPRKLASRIGSLSVSGGTPMAEAVMHAAACVARREETLKGVIVVTDGDPNDDDATREVIDQVRNAGIIVAGLGIGVNPAPVFGEKYAVQLDNISELSKVMSRLVRTAMLAQKK